MLVGRSVDSARVALQSVPLARRRLRPRQGADTPGRGREADAPRGFLSANGTVRLWVSAAQDGLVPNLVGSSLPAARELSRKLRLRLRSSTGTAGGHRRKQSLDAGVAAQPGLSLTLLVGRGGSTS